MTWYAPSCSTLIYFRRQLLAASIARTTRPQPNFSDVQGGTLPSNLVEVSAETEWDSNMVPC